MVYAFADESGNTGTNILDPNQPVFFSAALVTRDDFDLKYGPQVRALTAELGLRSLHASAQDTSLIGKASPRILDILRESESQLVICGVNKKLHASFKIYDYIYDPGENPAAHWPAYWMKPLRVLSSVRFALALPDRDLEDGWNALMDTRQQYSVERFREVLIRILPIMQAQPDVRTREILSEPITFAIAHPEVLNTHADTRTLRNTHLPNIALFPELLFGMESAAREMGGKIDVIRHDRVAQFENNLKTWHRLCSEVKMEPLYLPFDLTLRVTATYGSSLELVASDASPGVQVVDHILWLLSRCARKLSTPAESEPLIEYISEAQYQHYITIPALETYMMTTLQELDSKPFTKRDAARASRLLAKSEKNRQENMGGFQK